LERQIQMQFYDNKTNSNLDNDIREEFKDILSKDANSRIMEEKKVHQTRGKIDDAITELTKKVTTTKQNRKLKFK
jgi:hypothetical protein